MPPQPTNVRDAALRRLARANRWLVAGSVALTAVFSEVAASAFPGKTVKTPGSARAHRAHRSTRSSSSAKPLQPPTQAPSSSTLQESSTESSARESTKKGGAVRLPFCDANHGTITRTVIGRMTGPANCEMIGAMNDVTAPSAPPVTGDPFARAAASAATLKGLAGTDGFDAVVVLGSGWLAAADAIGAPEAEISIADLGGFEQPTVKGHTPSVRYIRKGQLRVLLYLGRIHLYEGHHPHAVVHGVRTAIAAGCRTVVLTNAAGGINADYAVGQPVLISDHLNLTGRSPLTGSPPPDGHRFVDLTDLYSERLRGIARAASQGIAEGVYAALPGPHYETPAEIRMLRTLGADLVGMSTALEAIAARHLGAEVLGISLVSNLAAGLTPQPLDHAEVTAAGDAAAGQMGALLAAVLPGVR